MFGVLVLSGCGGAQDDSATETDESVEEALTSGAKSHYPLECPGRGWSDSVTSWTTAKGTYVRTTNAGLGGGGGRGEPSRLTIDADPPQSPGMSTYSRTIDGVVDTGTIGLGVDNPAIGPVMQFADANGKAKDLYWVLDQKRSAAGKITGICLGKAAGADGQPVQNALPFMLKRVGR